MDVRRALDADATSIDNLITGWVVALDQAEMAEIGNQFRSQAKTGGRTK